MSQRPVDREQAIEALIAHGIAQGCARFGPAVRAILNDDFDDATARRRARQLLAEHVVMNRDRPPVP
jgi:hypothetical protein